MPRILSLQCPDRGKSAWQLILNTMKSFDIKCSKLEPTNEGFKAFLDSDEDVDKLFSDESISQLRDARAHPLKPRYLMKNRTVLVKSVDRFIMEYSEEEIQLNLNTMNVGSFSVVNVHKFPSGKTFKFECTTSTMATKCVESGLVIFNLCISPVKLALEESEQISYCYKCYNINSHFSAKCTKSSSYKVCSLCASTDHTYKNCTSTLRKCLNCDDDHATMSRMCPKYKDAKLSNFNSLPDAAKENLPVHVGRATTRQYSDAISTVSYRKSNQGLSRDDMFRGYMSLLLATNLEHESPGTFNSNLAKLLAENNLPTFNTANLVPSGNEARDQTLEAPAPQPTVMESSKLERLENLPTSNSDKIEGSIQVTQKVTKNSDVISAAPRATRSQASGCKIYVRQTQKQKLTKGRVLIDGINSRDIAIEHFCSDETKCMHSLSKKILAGDHSHLSVSEIAQKKFEEKYSILMSSSS